MSICVIDWTCLGMGVLTFWASAPVTATMRRMPLAMASSETMTNGAAWLEFCRWLKTTEKKINPSLTVEVEEDEEERCLRFCG